MAFFQSKQLLYPGPIGAIMEADGANDLIPLFGDFVVPAGMVTGDIVEMVALPANYVPVDLVAAFEAVASGAATVDIGLLTGNAGALLDVAGAAKVCGNEANATADVHLPIIVRPVKKDFAMIAPAAPDPTTSPLTTGDRSFGFKIVGTLTTLVVGAKVRFTLTARPKVEGL